MLKHTYCEIDRGTENKLTCWAVEAYDKDKRWLLLVEHPHLAYYGYEPSKLAWLQALSPHNPSKIEII